MSKCISSFKGHVVNFYETHLFTRPDYLKTPEGYVAVYKCLGRRRIYLTFIRTLVIFMLIFHDNIIRRLPLAEAYS